MPLQFSFIEKWAEYRALPTTGMPPLHSGVHCKNRHGSMLSALNVHSNVAAIHKVGQLEANAQMQRALSWLLKVITGRSTSKKIKHLLLVLKASWRL